MQSEKNSIIASLRQAMMHAAKNLNIRVITGEACFANEKCLKVKESQSRQEQLVEFDRAILAVGSAPVRLDNFGNNYIDSSEALELQKIPASILIIGGGTIGCELAWLFAALGTKVKIVEKMPEVLSSFDARLARSVRQSLEKMGVEVKLNSDASNVTSGYERCIVCIGRKPVLDTLKLKALGIETDGNGWVKVDENFRTSINNIFAVGDMNGKVLLAHAAQAQGEVAALEALGLPHSIIEEANVPKCVYTFPQATQVGLTEKEATEKGIATKSRRSYFRFNSIAMACGQTEGFVQVVSDEKTCIILGAQILGQEATELIHIITIAVQLKLTVEQMRKVIFAHPTLSEIYGEVFRK
jgi:dihydrolipoamide dehydrogenase